MKCPGIWTKNDQNDQKQVHFRPDSGPDSGPDLVECETELVCGYIVDLGGIMFMVLYLSDAGIYRFGVV